jgi:hypothetical protein
VVAAAAAMMVMLAIIAPRFTRRLAAGLAVAESALFVVEMTAASAAAATAAATITTKFPFPAGVGLRLRRLGGRATEELFHPAEQAAGFSWRGSLGRGGKSGLARTGPRRTGLGRPLIPAFTFRTEDRSFTAVIFAPRTLAGGRDLGGATRFTGRRACHAAE